MPLGYSTVRVNVGALIIDGVDFDDEPDDVPVTGTMVLTPMLDPTRPVQVTDGGVAKIKAIAPFSVEIGLNGEVSHRNRDYVNVPAPTSLTSNLSMLQWRATFNGLKFGATAVTLPPIYFWAEPGLEVNLADHLNVGPNSTALQLSRGPRGFGISEVEADGAELVFLSEADGAPEIGRVTLPPQEAVIPEYLDKAALDGRYAPVSRAAKNPDEIAVGTITRSASGAATGFAVVWDDGASGVFTGSESTSTPGAIDSYTVTHVLGGVTTTYTQPALTRNASGSVTARPAMTVS